jgi:hypothetical protein
VVQLALLVVSTGTTARCNPRALSLCMCMLLAVPQQQHYEGSDVNVLLTAAAVAAATASRLGPSAPSSVYRGTGMQPPVARCDNYRDGSYAGSYSSGGYAAGSGALIKVRAASQFYCDGSVELAGSRCVNSAILQCCACAVTSACSVSKSCLITVAMQRHCVSAVCISFHAYH